MDLAQSHGVPSNPAPFADGDIHERRPDRTMPKTHEGPAKQEKSKSTGQ